jgi:hypothetical protein
MIDPACSGTTILLRQFLQVNLALPVVQTIRQHSREIGFRNRVAAIQQPGDNNTDI